MGFFSKIWKGLKKGVKSIGKGIKSAFKKFGKFMNKIGILGQVAMFFIMPYVGAALGGMWTGIAGQTAAQGAAAATAASTAATAGATAAGASASVAATAGATAAAGVSTAASGLMAGGAVSQAVGSAMRFVGSTVSKGFSVYSNITQGITETLGNFAKTASNNLFGTSFDAAANFFGPGDSAFNRSFGESGRISNLTKSESFFEGRDAVRESNFKISQTEKALNSPKGQQAMADTVPQDYGNDGFGFGSDYANNIQRQIDMSQSNLTASLDPNYVPDRAGLRLETAPIDSTSLLNETAATNIVRENLGMTPLGESNLMQPSFEYGQAGSTGVLDGINVAPQFKVPEIKLPENLLDILNETRAGGPAPVIDKSFTYRPSLMERLQTGISEAPTNAYKKLGEIADDPLGYAGKGMEERFQSATQTRIMQEAGLVEKPEYIQNYVSNNAYVPSFESFGGAQQQYGASEIMNARSFEQQVTNNPSPYGYTAFQYGNYMAQYGQTA